MFAQTFLQKWAQPTTHEITLILTLIILKMSKTFGEKWNFSHFLLLFASFWLFLWGKKMKFQLDTSFAFFVFVKEFTDW